MSENLNGRIDASASALSRLLDAPWGDSIGLVLGSGFRSFADEITVEQSAAVEDIPYFNPPKVAGHAGSIISGKFEGRHVVVLGGRSHLYEGFDAESVVHPVRTLARLGVQKLILTNAAGSVNPSLTAGQLVIISDHINMTGRNCLIGAKDLGPQFVDMVNAYDLEWREKIKKNLGINDAIYLGLLGPNYETPAETRMARTLGADLVGMSTVQETMAARQLGVTTIGLSLITNMAGGLADEVNHEEVLDMGRSQASALSQALGQAIICAPH